MGHKLVSDLLRERVINVAVRADRRQLFMFAFVIRFQFRMLTHDGGFFGVCLASARKRVRRQPLTWRP